MSEPAQHRIVVGGAGPTRVEMAGQIAEIARNSRLDFRQADTASARTHGRGARLISGGR